MHVNPGIERFQLHPLAGCQVPSADHLGDSRDSGGTFKTVRPLGEFRLQVCHVRSRKRAIADETQAVEYDVQQLRRLNQLSSLQQPADRGVNFAGKRDIEESITHEAFVKTVFRVRRVPYHRPELENWCRMRSGYVTAGNVENGRSLEHKDRQDYQHQ